MMGMLGRLRNNDNDNNDNNMMDMGAEISVAPSVLSFQKHGLFFCELLVFCRTFVRLCCMLTLLLIITHRKPILRMHRCILSYILHFCISF